MKKVKIFLIFLILFISISAAYADGNFTTLKDKVNQESSSLVIDQDYAFDSQTDKALENGVVVNKTNFEIDGKGHTIDGKNQSRALAIYGSNITVSNLQIINGENEYGGGIINFATNLTLNNITFISNNAGKSGGALAVLGNTIVKNSNFINNYAGSGSSIYCEESVMECYESTFKTDNTPFKGMIYGSESTILVNYCTFANTTSQYAPAIYNDRKTYIYNSTFMNLHAIKSAGAVAIKELDDVEIINSTFINATSTNNGGAVFIDAGGFLYKNNGTIFIYETEFVNCSSGFGGALVILGGVNTIKKTTFSDNSAVYDGGALYMSQSISNISYTLFKNNKLTNKTEYLKHGGAIYVDGTSFTARNSEFKNNDKHGIYSYDTDLNVNQCIFENNTEAIHGVFLENYNLNNTYINDKDCLNDTDYIIYVSGIGETIELKNDTIFSEIPKRFDLRDWNWVSGVKNQGEMNSCWAFSYTGALESALIRRTGIEYDFSENNMQNIILKYAKYGIQGQKEGGDDLSAMPYVISWLGIPNYYNDEYDEVGKISPLIIGPDNIHVQDLIIVPKRNNSTDNNAIKEAILKYGSLSVGYYASSNGTYYNKNTSAIYYDGNETSNHMVSVVGWDDNYPASNFAKTPPKDGAWIIKNSYGMEYGDQGYNYISYYDTSFATTDNSVGFIFENTEKYNKNYQTDLSGKLEFYQSKQSGKNSSYKNVYTAIEDDLIAAVGTYFQNEGEAYTLEIYVNNQLKLTQSGLGPYYGYHTIKLNKTIAIEKGDEFTVMMTRPTVPIIEQSRQHYLANTSFVNYGEEWADLKDDSTVSLKVYTIDETILTKDLVKIYKNDSKFEAKIGVANQPVTFTINGATYTRISDEKGIASIAINLGPGNYTIETAFNGTSVKNNVEVIPTLIAGNLVKYYRNASQFYIGLIDSQGKSVSGTNITMNINGVFYNRATNENGIARLNINLIPGEYILTAKDPLTGLQMSYNITVLPTLTAEDLNMKYLDGSKFEAKLVDGQGKPIAGKNITFNINGVFYQRPTDENGTARLNIRLMAGEYIITSQYGQATISNKITISG